MQAVTRLNLEQAPKVKLWMPTRLRNGEGCTDREETGAGTRNSTTSEHLIGSTGVVRTACREGDLQRLGEARGWSGVATPNAGGGKGPVSPPLWGTQPCFWRVCEGGKER